MREIKRVIWHCTASPEGVDLKTSAIRAMHKRDRGWSDIGYHFVIELDGTICDGRPVERPGAHVSGHNEDSIGIAYVGGVAKDGKTPKDTRTDAQKSALYSLTDRILDKHPGATVHGHNEFAAKACPSFNAAEDWAKYRLGGLSPWITPGLRPEDMHDEDFEP